MDSGLEFFTFFATSWLKSFQLQLQESTIHPIEYHSYLN